MLQKFLVGGVVQSDYSVSSLRDKERLRDRESLTIYFTAKFKIEVFYTSIGSRKKTGKAKGWVKKNHMDFSIFGSDGCWHWWMPVLGGISGGCTMANWVHIKDPEVAAG